MTRLLLSSLGVFAISFCSLGGPLQEPQKLEPTPTRIMEKKLNSAKEIVGGLATEDFDKISKAAQELLLLSHESDWNVIQSKSYLQLSSEFRNSATRLRNGAHHKDTNAATLAYFELTLNCVRCHQYLREQHRDNSE